MGLLLRPYSLGHDLRLTRQGNPLANSDTGTLLDLRDAALICHQGWRECERMPWDPLIRFKLWLWRRRARKCSFALDLATFTQYRAAGSLEFPPSGVARPSADPSDARIAGCPFILRLQQFLMIHLRLTEEQAWDYPLGLAKCRWGCYWEENGDWNIYNEGEAALDKYVLEQEAKGAAQL
jgi:hypothetical protein